MPNKPCAKFDTLFTKCTTTVISYYKPFDEFCIRIKSLNLSHGWNIENSDGEYVKIQKEDHLHLLI